MVPELFVIGLVAGFLYYEWVGLSPGGVIPPAYFALFIRQPERLAVTMILALAVCGIVHLLQRRTFLYGRRRLLAALLLGFVVKWLVERVVAPASGLPMEIHAVGYVVPGLVANDMIRQRVVPTVLSLGIVTLVTALVGLLLGLGRVLP
jgi:poly-gamma-glutamate biosynthesis protein PgsC/CapC